MPLPPLLLGRPQLPTGPPQQELLLAPAPEQQALKARTQLSRRPEQELVPMVQEPAQPVRMLRPALQRVP